ncbi:VP3 [Gokushovirus WZ-2015a]|nr:VP3 [Gokushovirus WZ-2015a]
MRGVNRMLNFPTQYREPIRKYTDPGTAEKITYQLQTDKNGVQDLQPIGKINTYERIQSWQPSCDLKTILARFANGDQNALNVNAGALYGDFTDAPVSLADFYSRLAEAERVFYNLPVEIRSECSHSPSVFYSRLGDPDFLKRLGNRETPVPVAIPSPVPEGGEVSE